ncbi:glycosyltransferase [Pontibacter vulgaris]|uniref:glycosyltransferase n=1 Tax=Pontibacter vulgaris TaxID=2905679 RepID=UPI001FA76B79
MLAEVKEGFSIVICTYNGESRLEATLLHISLLEIPEDISIELIVVNNASKDNTISFVKSCWEKFGNPFTLKVIDECRPGKGYAIETGYDSAKYSFILTADDDNWLDPKYLVNAYSIFKNDPEIGILQGHSTGVFETQPPIWIENFFSYFIIGSPIKEPGYFNKNNCWVWGAGMIIKACDWYYIRSLGFSTLTSKIPGKAAGEDNEVAIAILMLGRKIYYSDRLKYKHYMPKDRVELEKLKNNFETFGYVTYHFLLYAIIFDSFKKGYNINLITIHRKFWKFWYMRIHRFTLKQHVAYWIVPLKILNRYRPNEVIYQLEIQQYFSLMKWYIKLNLKSLTNLRRLKVWMWPLLKKNSNHFKLMFGI